MMSAEKRRTMLWAFGGLAVVLVAIITIVSPSFRQEEASGAIGAVQKHRQPQITQQDVILGNNPAQEDHQALFAGYLSEAGALQNLVANIEMASRSDEAGARLRDASLALDARAKESRQQFVQNMGEALAAIKSLEAARQAVDAKALGQLEQDVAALAARQNQQLASEEMQAMAARLKGVATQLGIAPCCSRSLKSIEGAEANLAAARAAHQSDVQLASRKLAAADEQLASTELASRIRARAEYAAEMADEAQLAAKSAQSLAQLASDENVEARVRNAEMLASELASRAAKLEAKALAAMQARLRSDEEMAAAMMSLNRNLEAFSRENVDARLRNELAAFAAKAQKAQSELQGRMQSGSAAQLAALDQHLQSRDQISARVASMDQLEGRARAVRASKQPRNRSIRFRNQQSDEALEAHLASLSRSAGSEALAAQAKALLQRAQQ